MSSLHGVPQGSACAKSSLVPNLYQWCCQHITEYVGSTIDIGAANIFSDADDIFKDADDIFLYRHFRELRDYLLL